MEAGELGMGVFVKLPPMKEAVAARVLGIPERVSVPPWRDPLLLPEGLLLELEHPLPELPPKRREFVMEIEGELEVLRDTERVTQALGVGLRVREERPLTETVRHPVPLLLGLEDTERERESVPQLETVPLEDWEAEAHPE